MSPRFRYKAINDQGLMIKGEHDGEKISDISDYLFTQKLTPVDIQPVSAATPNLNLPTKKSRINLNSQQLLQFTLACTQLLQAGFPIDKALYTLRQTSPRSSTMYALSTELFSAIEKGLSLSQALRSIPGKIPDVYINLIQAGEEAGQLRLVFQRLSAFLSDLQEFQKTVRGILLYPCIVLGLSSISLLILFTFVVPRFSAIFVDISNNHPLPWITQLILNISAHLSQSFFVLLAVLGIVLVLIYGLWRYQRTRRAIHRLSLLIPLWNTLVRKIMFARFASTLAMLLEGGLTLVPALHFSAGTINQWAIAQALRSVIDDVKKGIHLPQALRRHPHAFPLLAIHMLSVGDETGHLEGSLKHIAQTYETDIRNTLKTITTILSPLLILLMGLLIAVVISAMLLPMLNLTQMME